ncbi:hypothetical protein [Nitrosomonas marina]|uniref:Uncharacterized protein n=1 Tax=Nitrosomonas marina TaxID=917 RepID=A0A1H8BAW0_9PROT|nr:hypothetical protein [Nitrosomonas marina]SEM79963.1 hypothetical protein SAMN05216325_102185 [Nitrosomonas marina]
MLGILDIIIAVFLIYALFSGLVSGLNELIVQMLAMRGRILFESIAALLGELPRETGSASKRWFSNFKRMLGFIDRQKAQLTSLLYQHPLIDTLSPPGGSKPSYIPPAVFSTALVQVLSNNNASLDAVRQSLAKRPEPLNKLLMPMLDEAGYDLEKFKLKIEQHYIAVMDRVGGWYKRRSQFMMFVIAFVLASGFNVDSIYIVQQMQKNPEQIELLVNIASEYSAETGKSSINITGITGTSADQEKIDPEEALLRQIGKLNVDANDFRNLGLPVGWHIPLLDAVEHTVATQKTESQPLTLEFLLLPGQNNWLLIIIGWIITALAGTLGAPFWFDAISKLFTIRGTGKKPE